MFLCLQTLLGNYSFKIIVAVLVDQKACLHLYENLIKFILRNLYSSIIMINLITSFPQWKFGGFWPAQVTKAAIYTGNFILS